VAVAVTRIKALGKMKLAELARHSITCPVYKRRRPSVFYGSRQAVALSEDEKELWYWVQDMLRQIEIIHEGE
jgi:hypothetical protein